MLELFERNADMSKKVIKTFDDSLAKAIEYVNNNYAVFFFETDKDYENCADFFLSDGRIMMIQPIDFKL